MNWSDIAGLTGAAMQLAGYAAVQLGRLDPHRGAAVLLNLVGSGLLITSLAQSFNLAAFLLECAWGTIALGGLIAIWRQRNRARQASCAGAPRR